VLAHPDKTLTTLAAASGMWRKRLCGLLAVSCLAPDMVEAVMTGKQPPGLTAERLMAASQPVRWDQQRELIGMGGRVAWMSLSLHPRNWQQAKLRLWSATGPSACDRCGLVNHLISEGFGLLFRCCSL
jgi:hypothetical protein